MAGIAGWIGSGSQGALHAMAQSLSKYDQRTPELHYTPAAALVVCDHAPQRSYFDGHALLAAVWGDVRFLDPELAAVRQRDGAAAACLQAYLSTGSSFLSRIRGSCAIAIQSRDGTQCLLASDRAGIRPIVYRRTSTGLAFASSGNVLGLHPDVDRSVEPQALYDYLHFHIIPGPGTIFQGESRLLPGEFLHLRGGSLVVDRYWTPRFVENSRAPFGALKDEFIRTLESGVERSVQAGGTGCFLSGGTDSSTVAGMVGRVTKHPASTFSIGFDQAGYDEMEYARIAARHFETEHHEYYVSPDDIVEAIPKLAEIHDQPFGNSSAVPAYFCAKLARQHGFENLLAGDGGDELFGGNDRYATQYLFSLYERLPSGLRDGLITPAAGRLPLAIKPLRWIRRYVEIASNPMPGRLDTHNLLKRLGVTEVCTSEFLATVDIKHPAALMSQAYQGVQAESLINRMLALDWKITLADNDLPKVLRSCELAGIGVAFPLLDDDLIEFSMKLPPDLKLRRTYLRYFFKKALRGFLPEEIIRKKKHGFGLPFGHWVAGHSGLREMAHDSLSALKTRHIVRPAFIDALIGAKLSEHASYYGTMVWILMMLEQWLQRHERRIRASPSVAATA